jgi:hypothetical protein
MTCSAKLWLSIRFTRAAILALGSCTARDAGSQRLDSLPGSGAVCLHDLDIAWRVRDRWHQPRESSGTTARAGLDASECAADMLPTRP